MKILVTGGCGYIGAHVAWALADAGCQIVILDDLSTGSRENIPRDASFILGDIGDSSLVEQILSDSVEAVIHLAGKILPEESLSDPLTYFQENTGKSIVLLRAMRRVGVSRLIFSSTAAVYGPSVEHKVTENSPTRPVTPYGLSKLMTEQVIAAASAAHGLRSIALRYFNVAGVDELRRCGPRGPNPGHLIRTAVDVALARKPLLQIFGDDYATPDGTCVRDYIHVADLADAHLVALKSLEQQNGYRALNCGYGRGASVKEVVRAVEAVTGKSLPYEIAPRRAGDPPALIADSSSLTSLGTWQPRFDDLATIIRSVIAWENPST